MTFAPEMPIFSSESRTAPTAGSTNPIFTAVPPTLATAPFGPVSPYVSAISDMPPMTSTTTANTLLIAELENKLRQEQVGKVASCSLWGLGVSEGSWEGDLWREFGRTCVSSIGENNKSGQLLPLRAKDNNCYYSDL